MTDVPTNDTPPIRGWRWWARELLAISTWSIIVLGPFMSRYVDADTLNRVTKAFTFENILVTVFLLLGASWLIGLRTMWHVAFVAAYPVIVPLRIVPKMCIRHWPILFVFLPGIRGLVSGMRLRAGLLCLALAAAVGAFNFTNPAVLAACWAVLCAYLVWIFAHQLHMAYRPVTAYSELVDILQRASTWFPSAKELAAKLKNPQTDAKESKTEPERSRAASLLILYGGSTALHYVARHLDALQRSFKLDIYLVWCVMKSFVLTIVIFTVIFASMGLADSHHFKIDGPVNFVDYAMFSFCNLMTSEVSGIEAVSGAARGFACLELLFAFGLLVLIVFVVFTSLRERHRTDLQLVVSKFQAASSDISELFESDFALTRSAVEGILIGFAPSFAKQLIAIQHGKAYAEQLYNESKQKTSGQSAVIEVGSVGSQIDDSEKKSPSSTSPTEPL